MNYLLHDDQRHYVARPSIGVYECPDGVSADAKNVSVEAYPNGGTKLVRVQVGTRIKAAKRIDATQAKPGERVLLSLMHRDLLSLFVATVEA